ncbi:MAG: glycosyltransferase [Janthinobacterium lividum]
MTVPSAAQVSVVLPYYDDPRLLDLVLTGLELQTLPVERFEVVIADDGSPTPPDPGTRPYPVRVVVQGDQGFRAAAARNLGAAASSGDVLCFLDADTVPEPGYLAAVLAGLSAPLALVVGRRRHAELREVGPDALRGWLRGDGAAPREFEEPGWLSAAYARTEDLRSAGDDAYRFVISAVLSVTRELFERVGGFEEAFTAYGGEDWEFAHRCWLAGAEFAHVRDAVAWHDGPEFAGREAAEARRSSQNTEGLTLARFVTDPAARGGGLIWRQPDIVVRLDDVGADVADVVRSLTSLLQGSDAGVWLRDGAAAEHLQDPRVHVGEPPPEVVRRCRFQAEAGAPVLLEGATLRDLTDVAPVRVGEFLQVRRTRDVNRGVEVLGTVTGVLARRVRGVNLQREWGHDEHVRVPRLQRSLRTPFVVSSTPSSPP